MFGRKKINDPDWDLKKLTDEHLAKLPLVELQRIRNKRWANGYVELQKRAEEELQRRDPRNDWQCLRCQKTKFHQKEVRVSGSLTESFFGWERSKYHAIVCNYCGKSELYSVMMTAGEERISFFGS